MMECQKSNSSLFTVYSLLYLFLFLKFVFQQFLKIYKANFLDKFFLTLLRMLILLAIAVKLTLLIILRKRITKIDRSII